ncbi:MAG: hypothetical protein CO186_08495 [Zetaproteobacteria bacterium CG_4_9_14_3_um_filter_49_83]|nr:MAG: hypothetical protein AUJ56_10085 [Zetaproteobacteria bacterium CG1_02_49_23]PIQ31335.1 MAG: hypothetical protein COW62_10030 [Zetaproteobacteria bacterium CG17_big_fil_post_rev_8_21_14_2_50_50_13]PIV30878.1 MAG: hypothetical protein COS35_04270 [Zetaproteobacteria bacterium CG02_land_8_20_14_3_00_50_9]PIY55365.1 MAG: hypothetical protein COZ00_09785 [Zetaproteobacteria bacterium CG_4_10_14_0_8_um_filter_49_80]PJA34943.1 MAG: hypothetical protein CO186_08495 [Zetaproteobacteria bacterium
MSFGLKTETIHKIQGVLALFPDIEKVIVYGSRAKGNYRNGSDIDLTLQGKALTPDHHLYPLLDKLDELNLPYTFDISIFDQLEHPDLLAHIDHVGQVFYEGVK